MPARVTAVQRDSRSPPAQRALVLEPLLLGREEPGRQRRRGQVEAVDGPGVVGVAVAREGDDDARSAADAELVEAEGRPKLGGRAAMLVSELSACEDRWPRLTPARSSLASL